MLRFFRGPKRLLAIGLAGAGAVASWGQAIPIGDSGQAATDSLSARAGGDSIPESPAFGWESPYVGGSPCRELVESLSECWRREPGLVNQEVGFPGVRSWTLSLTQWNPLPFTSVFFPVWRYSPYMSGGLAPPERYRLGGMGGEVQSLQEIWNPVLPLDTPVTKLAWVRGALSLNVFHLKLKRMLSSRSYVSLDYYSATGDSQVYDYPFNVHQPYLGGWAFLGKIYAPIDRDSASLVIDGVSNSIGALEARPRLGWWLTPNQALEVFLDRVRNNTSLSLPRGPSVAGSPGRADSVQALVPNTFGALTEGIVYAAGGALRPPPAGIPPGQAGERFWTSQWDFSHSGVNKEEALLGDSLLESFAGDLFQGRGKLRLPGLFATPELEAEATNENWEGPMFLHGPGAAASTVGWSDRQSVRAGLSPRLDWAGVEAEAGLGRASRMDNRENWLWRYGAALWLNAPWGLAAEGGLSSQDLDPDWETLYRFNPARFHFPNPGLRPRSDRAYHAGLAWTLGGFSVEGGADLLRSENAWLPGVVPGAAACEDLEAGLYRDLPGVRCLAGEAIPDSAALRLRNYREEARDSWHAGVGLALGNWSLLLRNRYLFNSAIQDAGLAGEGVNGSLPDRVYQGRLAWRRVVLDGRLRLKMDWDWEWFSTRYAWAPDLQGNSRLSKLDEYLVLDFMISMQIRSFLLFFKGMNFNHDRYATEPGVHPPGINFRFGIDWTLWN